MATTSVPHLGIGRSCFLSDQHQMSLPIHQHLFLVLLACPEELSQVMEPSYIPSTLVLVPQVPSWYLPKPGSYWWIPGPQS